MGRREGDAPASGGRFQVRLDVPRRGARRVGHPASQRVRRARLRRRRPAAHRDGVSARREPRVADAAHVGRGLEHAGVAGCTNRGRRGSRSSRRTRAQGQGRRPAEPGAPRHFAAERDGALRRPHPRDGLWHRPRTRAHHRDRDRRAERQVRVHVARAARPRRARSALGRVGARHGAVGGHDRTPALPCGLGGANRDRGAPETHPAAVAVGAGISARVGARGHGVPAARSRDAHRHRTRALRSARELPLLARVARRCATGFRLDGQTLSAAPRRA